MEKETLVRPSLLSADFNHLGDAIEEALSLGITNIHYDVMDGTFVDAISFGEPVFKRVNLIYGNQIIFDVHLMTVNPLKQVNQFAALGCKEICFHFETLTLGDIPKIKEVRDRYPNIKIGLAFSPETEVDELKNLFNFFDFILVMSVIPGKAGQKFITGSEKKIAQLNEYRKTFGLDFKIGVDGGINDVTGPLCVENGVDWLVAGSYYFNATNKKVALNSLHKAKVIK